ncbi:MAG: Uma2 family endonuclease [Rhodothermaceae bacterium]|nr:Uma2 family endonuclease [Rhodothermaceae bacterium]
MATKFAYIPCYTVEDYEQWVAPNCELIQGIPHMMSPAPRIAHQWVSHRLEMLLEEALGECRECEVLPPVNYRIADDTMVRPDILMVCSLVEAGEDIYLATTPSLIFEIVPPSSALKDRIVKCDIYEAAGVRYYAVADSGREEAEVPVLHDGAYETHFTGHAGPVPTDLGACAFELDMGSPLAPVFHSHAAL